MMMFGEKVITFNRELHFSGELPKDVAILNPFENNPEINRITGQFYRKFYGDLNPRKLIIGINPSRLGGGATGIPFTDTKRLKNICGISVRSVATHEPSSVFIYKLIEAYGGPERFYGDFYINSICPLGFVIRNNKNNLVNYNYYDSKELYEIMYDFMIESFRKQLEFGIDREIGYVLGKKNYTFLRKINEKEKFFDKLVELEHPRYIVQYRPKETDQFIAKYLELLSNS